MKQYIYALALYLMAIFSLASNIIIHRSIGAPVNGKDVADGLDAIIIFRKQMNRFSKRFTTTCKSLGMLHSFYSMLAVSFSYQ